MELEKSDEFDENDDVALDLPPEYCQYRDEGCDLADSCLNCSFPQCIYDEPRGKQHWLKKLRDREIVRLFSSEGQGVKELALMFCLSQRTIQRALKSSLLTSVAVSYRGEGRYGCSEGLRSLATPLLLPSHLNKSEKSGRGKTMSKGDLFRNE